MGYGARMTGQPNNIESVELKAAGLRKFLARLLLRSELSEEERQAILALDGDVVRTVAHRDIVRPGQTIDYACLVIGGLAGRFDQLASGKRQITALHIIGDMCDLHSVAVPHTGWGIEALSDTLTLRIPHHALRNLTVSNPRIAFAFWRDTIADASILAKWISALGRRAACGSSLALPSPPDRRNASRRRTVTLRSRLSPLEHR